LIKNYTKEVDVVADIMASTEYKERLEIAYAAGIIDGEASLDLGIYLRKSTYNGRMLFSSYA